MTKPDEAIRKVIDEESVNPRMANYREYLALQVSEPLPVARADLLYLWDDYRGEYLDFAATSTPLGHAHPVVAQAVAEHGRYYGFTGPQGHHLLRWPVQYAKSLSEAFSGESEPARRVLYTEGQYEALRLAVDLAIRRSIRLRPVPPNPVVVGPGHHRIGGSLSYPWDFDPVDARWDSIAALLISPVSEDARVIPNGAARRWMLAARAEGVPVVYDETVTGFGRLGTMWGQQSTDLTADLTVLGGPCGGGWPLGAVIAPPEYFAGPLEVSAQAGHPVACCAGAVTLDVIRLGVLEYMEETTALLTKGLDELCDQFPHYLTGHHGKGLLRGLTFTDPDTADRFTRDCRPHGLYVAPAVDDVVVLAPVLVTSTHEMTRGADLVAATLLSWDDGDRPV
jgi:4-aminobutyrate aminotransferase-like enzyme